MDKVLLDPRSADFPDPQLSLLYGQIDTAQQFLFWLIQRCTPDELEYRGPAGDRNSIASLVLHIAGCNLQWVFKVLQRQPIPADLQERFICHEGEGPLPEVRGLSAQELMDRHRETVGMVKAYMLTLRDTELDRVVSLGPRVDASVRWGLWHLAEHSMLHQGHIRWLRTWYRESR